MINYIIFIVVFFIGFANSTDILGGDIYGTWTKAESPYYIHADINIPENSTLIIEPGVQIIFKGFYELYVGGKILANGVEGDSIIFKAEDPNTGWKGIHTNVAAAEFGRSEFTYCVFSDGKALEAYGNESLGGAIYAIDPNIYIGSCRFHHCAATYGGAVATERTAGGEYHFVIENSKFEYNNGGATDIDADSVTIKNCIFTCNSGDSRGGISISALNFAKIENCDILNNHNDIESGGGISLYVSSGKGEIKYCKICNNYGSFGSAIWASGNIKLLNNLICNNSGYYGVVLEMNNDTLLNNTITNNDFGGIVFTQSSPVVENTILWGNLDHQVYLNDNYYGNSDPYFYYCDIQGGMDDFSDYMYGGDYDSTRYENNIETEPLFIEPTEGAGQAYDGYNANWELSSNSPCIDAGNPDTDLNLVPTDLNYYERVVNGRIDIGAYEFNDDPFVFSPHLISNKADYATCVFSIDLDNDGDIDVLSSSAYDDEITWYENDGNQNFKTHMITNNTDFATHVFAIDLDNDNDIDVLSSSGYDNKIAWYENDGNQNFTTHIITTTATSASSVYAIDLDSDGDIDVLSSSCDDDKIAWYENDGNQNFTTHIITTNANFASSVYAIDLDSDGDIDVLSSSEADDKIAWYENDGEQNFITHVISTDADGPESVFAIDLDQDSDIDVLSASVYDNRIVWFENDGNQNFTAHNITTEASGAFSVYAVDLDGDFDIDVLSASESDDKIAWYENDGNCNFTTHVVTTNADEAHSVYAIDLDNDGDVDILSASSLDDKIAWYENETPVSSFRTYSNLFPKKTNLGNNYPNPFNPTTTIQYYINQTTNVTLIIYNMLGQKISILINKKQEPGNYSVKWNGKNDFGRNVASGIYLYQLKTKDFVKTKKMILIR